MGTYKEQTGKSIQQAFEEYHSKNPKVYTLFCQQCLRAIARNRTKISSKQILGHIRWEISLETDSDDGFKINDAFTSHYPRLFIKDYPQYSEIFNFRGLRGDYEIGPQFTLTDYQRSILYKIHFEEKELVYNVIVSEYQLLNSDNKLYRSLEPVQIDILIEKKFVKRSEIKSKSIYDDIKYVITESGIKKAA